MLNITNDMLQMKDYNQSTALSAAFDLVDHDILVNRLENYFGFTATVLHWFIHSCLKDLNACSWVKSNQDPFLLSKAFHKDQF